MDLYFIFLITHHIIYILNIHITGEHRTLFGSGISFRGKDKAGLWFVRLKDWKVTSCYDRLICGIFWRLIIWLIFFPLVRKLATPSVIFCFLFFFIGLAWGKPVTVLCSGVKNENKRTFSLSFALRMFMLFDAILYFMYCCITFIYV